MITEWRICNFKSVSDSGRIQIAPLTIFCGNNSSGKSTLLQSMLLVSQTLKHRVKSRPIALNGEYVRLGQYSDICNHNSKNGEVSIEWKIRPYKRFIRLSRRYFANLDFALRDKVQSISGNITFDASFKGKSYEVMQIQPVLKMTNISVQMCEDSGKNRDYYLKLVLSELDIKRRINSGSKKENSDYYNETNPRATYEISLDEDSMDEIRMQSETASLVNCELEHFLPSSLIAELDSPREIRDMIRYSLKGERRSYSLLNSSVLYNYIIPTSIMKEIRDAAKRVLEYSKNNDTLKREDKSNMKELIKRKSITRKLSVLCKYMERIPTKQLELLTSQLLNEEFERLLENEIIVEQRTKRAGAIVEVPGHIKLGIDTSEEYFTNGIKYIGPLRDEPKSTYPLTNAYELGDIGIRGENSAAVLEMNKNKLIEYIPAVCFKENQAVQSIQLCTLIEAIIDWLKYLGVAEDINTNDKGKPGYDLKVNIEGDTQPNDLTHVGVGVSQVLPILITGLLAEMGSTLIFEQPELHLHPRVQTLLTDFFLSMIKLGKQCIVETHSEYIISRLRFREASAKDGNSWIDMAKIYFVEKKEKGTEFRNVEINNYGAIIDWPDGFFDQSTKEAGAIIEAALLKARSKTEHQI